MKFMISIARLLLSNFKIWKKENFSLLSFPSATLEAQMTRHFHCCYGIFLKLLFICSAARDQYLVIMRALRAQFMNYVKNYRMMNVTEVVN